MSWLKARSFYLLEPRSYTATCKPDKGNSVVVFRPLVTLA